jgi:hypothetical protein
MKTPPVENPMSQAILTHLREFGHITAVEASAVYRTRSLSRRIRDIRDAGHYIESVFKRDPTGQRYVRYQYAHGPQVGTDDFGGAIYA